MLEWAPHTQRDNEKYYPELSELRLQLKPLTVIVYDLTYLTNEFSTRSRNQTPKVLIVPLSHRSYNLTINLIRFTPKAIMTKYIRVRVNNADETYHLMYTTSVISPLISTNILPDKQVKWKLSANHLIACNFKNSLVKFQHIYMSTCHSISVNRKITTPPTPPPLTPPITRSKVKF